MAESREQCEWERTAWLLSLIANVNRDPKQRSKPFTPAEFNPHRVKAERPKPDITVPMSALRSLFTKAEAPNRSQPPKETAP